MQKFTPLTESALLAAITVIIAVIAIYMPLVGTFATLVWACPLIVLTTRHGLRYGIMATFAATVITALVIEPLVSFRLSLAFAPGGLVMGFCLHKGFGAAKIFVPALIASILAKVAGLTLVFWLTAVNPLDMQIETLRETFNSTFELYENMGIDKAAITDAKERMTDSINLVALIMPLLIGLMGLVDVWLNYKIVGRILPRFGYNVPEFPPFSRWKFSVAFLYLLGFALVGMYWGMSRNIDLLYRVSLNANMLAMLVGFVEGLSLIRFVTVKYKISLWIFWAIVIIVITGGILAQFVAITGLFDMLFDYRRRFGGLR